MAEPAADPDSLFTGAPKHVQDLFKRAKAARRAEDRKKWAAANIPPAAPIPGTPIPPAKR